MEKIYQEVIEIEKNYNTPISLVDGLIFLQKDTIRTIEFRNNSRYLNGQKDEQNRDKPYYDILNGIAQVEDAAKDIDTKDIQIISDDGEHYDESFLMTKDVQQWMKEINFAKNLNTLVKLDTRYGTVLAKKVITTDEDGSKSLDIQYPAWKNTITSQSDILNNPIIEVHYLTPAQLLKKDVWENKEEAVKLASRDSKVGGKVIKVYELRGEFPVSHFKEINKKPISKSDKTKYSYQLYYLAVSTGRTGYNFIHLYSENDTEKVYKLKKRKERAGRDFGVGIFEEGEEAQVWTNDAVLKQYRAMEYTSKVIGQTASKKLKGRNLLTETDDGTILEHEDGKPITPLQLLPSGGLQQYSSLIEQWYSQLEKATSSYAAQRGDTPPSGQPFRLQALVLQQSTSAFSVLKQDLGIFITELFEDWVLPFLAKQLNTEHILAHDFSMDELLKIDHNFATYQANEMIKRKILNGEIVSADDYEKFYNQGREFIAQTRDQRFLKIPKNYYKSFKAKITVNVTGEQFNKSAVLESLSNILTLYAQNPSLTQDPVLSKIFFKIIELSGAGISPSSLMAAIEQQAKKQVNNAQAQLQQNAQPNAQPQPQMSLSANPTGMMGGANAS